MDGASPPVTWRYYDGSPYGLGYWTAPNAIYSICQNLNQPCATNNSYWTTHVIPSPYNGDYAQALNDIANCSLQNVSWVIPDGTWSDHPGTAAGTDDGGPSWVAQIVDAVGNATKCDSAGYWSDTVILVTWDDWGGFYDHKSPSSTGGPGIGYQNTTGQYYVYGFRVPLLVVSAYTTAGYVSGSKNGPGELPGYVHDFGSILGFIETVFNLPYGGISSSNFPYADYFAPDGPKVCQTCSYPLSDFFNNFKTQRAFTPINSWKYPPTCFHVPNGSSCFTNWQQSDPDDDAIDQQD